MTKLFKNGKSVLSFVIVFAVLAVSLFTGVVIKSDALSHGGSIVYWDGSSKTEPTTQDEDGNYIIDTAEKLAWIVGQTDASLTRGKNYKVADGIDAIILQKSTINTERLMGCANGEETKAYFDSIPRDKWVTRFSTIFAGNFDGNGVEIYGEYGYWDDAAQGVFGMVEQGVTLQNFAVRNSYLYKASHKAGAVFGGVTATGNGTITVENVVVSGCYIWSICNNANKFNVGAIAGTSDSGQKVGLTIKNSLVYNNTLTNTEDTSMNYGLTGTLCAGFNPDEGAAAGAYNKFENCIVLDCLPYNLADGQNQSLRCENFVNVYTDAVDPEDTAKLPCLIRNNIWGYTWNNYANKIIPIDRANLLGDAAKTTCPNLLWDSVWLATEGEPTLRALHTNVTVVDNKDGTHSKKCSCGIEISASEAHTWADGVCSVCGSRCTHTNTHYVKVSDADCTTAEMGKKVCDDCGAVTETDVTGPVAALGHNLELVTGTPATCTEPGTKDYYACSRCDAAFEDEAGATPIANLDKWKVEPAKGHTQATDSNGPVWGWKAEEPGKHFKLCADCGELYEGEACSGEYVADGANGHSGRCTVCGIQTAGVERHNFNAESVCTTCGWTCTDHNFEDYGMFVPSCVEDVTVQTKCHICGKNGTRVEPKKGHNFIDVEAQEGSCSSVGCIAHKYCGVCGKFFDANETDVYSTNYLSFEDISTPIVPDNHRWIEVKASDADHDNAGNVAYKFCEICGTLVVGDKEVELEIDYDALYEEIDAAMAEFEATRDQYATDEEYYAAWQDKFEAVYDAVLNKYVVAAAAEEGVEVTIPVKGHTLKKVDEVAATADKEGVKAHWVCEDCGKLYADENGATEVTAADLVIAKLTTGGTDTGTGTGTGTGTSEGNTDNSNESPKTGETVATVAGAVLAIIAAGFVLVRKARKA